MFRMIFRQWLFILLTSIFVCNAYSQNTSVALYETLTTTSSNGLEEKIFVHTDKTFYIAGEILWFKIYCVEAGSNKLLDLSKVAYVELLDSAHTPAVQVKIKMEKGTGNGSLLLPFNISSGSYLLRAYTNWMKNGSPADFFEKNIEVVSVQKLTVDNQRKKEENTVVRFYPEGGNLIQDIETKIGIRVTDVSGEGIRAKGVLMDGKDSLLSFSTQPSGIGSFSFTPLKNHLYSALIRPQSGNTFTEVLPTAAEEGYTLKVRRDNNKNILATVEAANVSGRPVYLIAHKNRVPFLAKEIFLQNDKAEVSLNDSLLPTGVFTFTLFDADQQPVAERLFYKKGTKHLDLTLKTEVPSYGSRKPVHLDISIAGNKVSAQDSANLSLSVYRIDSLQAKDNSDIDTYLNLTSDLHSSVEDIQEYVRGQSNNQDLLTDNLMLVSGGYHFTKNTTSTSPQLFSFSPEYKGHLIAGKIINSVTGAAAKNQNVYLSLPGKGRQFYTASSDANGNVMWETENWYGDAKLVAQANRSDTLYNVSINDPFSHQYSSITTPPFALPIHSPNTLLQHSISMQSETIYSNEERNRFSVTAVDSTPFFVTADKTYRLDDYARFTTIEEVLREYTALVNVTKRKGDYHFQVYDLSSEKMFDTDPLVLVDGIPYFDFNVFIKLDPLKMQKLEVVNRRYYYGNAVFDGVLNWHTYTRDAENIDIDPRAVIMDYEGLEERREFYSPSYATEAQFNSSLPDFRTTLYWNPDIRLSGTQSQRLSFFTSDLPGKYVAVAEGITTDGICVTGTASFDVEKK